jgi:hypothetical protein
MRDENDGFYFVLLDLLAPWLQVYLITLKYSAIMIYTHWSFPGNAVKTQEL